MLTEKRLGRLIEEKFKRQAMGENTCVLHALIQRQLGVRELETGMAWPYEIYVSAGIYAITPNSVHDFIIANGLQNNLNELTFFNDNLGLGYSIVKHNGRYMLGRAYDSLTAYKMHHKKCGY